MPRVCCRCFSMWHSVIHGCLGIDVYSLKASAEQPWSSQMEPNRDACQKDRWRGPRLKMKSCCKKGRDVHKFGMTSALVPLHYFCSSAFDSTFVLWSSQTFMSPGYKFIGHRRLQKIWRSSFLITHGGWLFIYSKIQREEIMKCFVQFYLLHIS